MSAPSTTGFASRPTGEVTLSTAHPHEECPMNTANLQKTRAYIAEHRGDFNQRLWMHECGTPACVAGVAVVACSDGKLLPQKRCPFGMCYTSLGVVASVSRYARTLLGLNSVDARDMFLICLLYTSPSPRDRTRSRMPSSA